MNERDSDMGDLVLAAIKQRVKAERFAKKMGLRLLEVAPGRAVVEMTPQEDNANIFDMTHGGAIFSLIDEAFQVSCNTHGTVAVALNMAITYHRAPERNRTLQAESVEVHLTKKTGTYDIKVRDEQGNLIASCMAVAFRKTDKLPFLE